MLEYELNKFDGISGKAEQLQILFPWFSIGLWDRKERRQVDVERKKGENAQKKDDERSRVRGEKKERLCEKDEKERD